MAGRRVWNRWTAAGAAVFVLVAAWFPYHRTSGAYCSKCWATFRVDEYGLAWDESTRWPLRREAKLTEEPPDSIRRFLAADHVHDSSAPGAGWNHSQLLISAICCGRRIPVGGFAQALECEPAFASFLDVRIAEGSLDVATVRALIAVPPRGYDDETPVADPGLLARGRDLYTAFHPRKGFGADVWEYLPPWIPETPVLLDGR